MSVSAVRRELERVADTGKKAVFYRFFKSGKGEYGEGDVFMGVTVPLMRGVAKQFKDLPLKDIKRLLADEVHEMRMTGLFILVLRFEKSDEARRQEIVDFYLSNLEGVNNWDLVDLSAYKILGEHLIGRRTTVLDGLLKTGDLWKQRIAMVSTYAFIRRGELGQTFRIAKILMGHEHDLIHKAVGWMLREAGKRDEKVLRKFLDAHAGVMPRTMLRYSIEKFDEASRRKYMRKGS